MFLLSRFKQVKTPLPKTPLPKTRTYTIIGLLVASLLLAACGASTPPDAPVIEVPTAVETPEAEPSAAATEVSVEEAETTESAEEGTEEATEVSVEEGAEVPDVSLPTVTPAPEADTMTDAEDGRVAAPTFDPTVNQIAFQPFLQGFNQPLLITHAGDESNRLFVAEKAGIIRIVREGTVVETPFLDITDRVSTRGNEQGLLGLAFPPNFNESGFFFVQYTDLGGDTAISRFQIDAANPDVADPASEFSVLALDSPASNHNGGMLLFGPDGYLWIGTGDGGGGGDTYGNGQDPTTLLGAMLRIDVTSDPSVPYTIPSDNPWIDGTWNGQEVRDEIWAIGLRNPWRYSFDRATGDLWIADVGQNIYEEVNYTVEGTQGGINYGWPIMEGMHCFGAQSCEQEGLVLPVAEYDHAKGCSITGGYVYRGSQYPMLQGVYIFGDYCTGIVWATIPNPDGSWNTTEMLDTDVYISSFGEDESGELYATDLRSGAIYQVVGQ